MFFISCTAPLANYQRTTNKSIETYFSEKPDKEYSEITMIVETFRERGFLTGTANEELLIKKLQDKAAKINADAIINIKIESEPVANETGSNKVWKASAIAIQYK